MEQILATFLDVLWQGCQTPFHQGSHERYGGPQRASCD